MIKGTAEQTVLWYETLPVATCFMMLSTGGCMDVATINCAKCPAKKGHSFRLLERNEEGGSSGDTCFTYLELNGANVNIWVILQKYLWKVMINNNGNIAQSTHLEIVSFDYWNHSPRWQIGRPVTRAYRKIVSCSWRLIYLESPWPISRNLSMRASNTCLSTPRHVWICLGWPFSSSSTQSCLLRIEVWYGTLMLYCCMILIASGIMTLITRTRICCMIWANNSCCERVRQGAGNMMGVISMGHSETLYMCSMNLHNFSTHFSSVTLQIFICQSQCLFAVTENSSGTHW